MKTVFLAKMVADLIDYLRHDAFHTAEASIEYLVRKIHGRGRIILADRDGRSASQLIAVPSCMDTIRPPGEA
ncbi:MAG: hypothetical protein WA970_08865 [Gammaproteobacteria bacterium]